MALGSLPAILSQLEEVAAAARRFHDVPRQAPPDDSDVLRAKVNDETDRLTAELKDGTQTAFGASSTYFGAPLLEAERAATYNQVLGALDELKMENESDSVENILGDVAQRLQTLKPLVEEGQLPVNLLLKGIQSYVQAPLSRWLGADALSRKIADDVQSLTRRQADLATSLEKALGEAHTRTERQSVKAEHFQRKEAFFTEALAKLEGHVDSDRAVLSSLEAQGAPEIEQALRVVQSLLKDTAVMRQHISSKGLSYETNPQQLQRAATNLQDRLQQNSAKLQASLSDTLRLLQEHIQLQEELNGVLINQKIRQQVQDAVEATRRELCAAVDRETARLTAAEAAVGEFLAGAKSIAQSIRGVCQAQQQQAEARMKENARLFAALYTDYYNQLQELHAGKVRCRKSLQVELNRLLKEQSRWEALEHELPGAEQLVRLDERLTQLKEFQAQLTKDIDALVTKLDTLKGCGADILAHVPDFVHPVEASAAERLGALTQKKRQLEAVLQKYGPLQLTEEDMAYDSSGAEMCSEPSHPIDRHVLESPYKIQRHLRRINEEIASSPYPTKGSAPDGVQELPEEGAPEVPVPTAEMLQLARDAQRAPGTRGTAFPGRKRRRAHRPPGPEGPE